MDYNEKLDIFDIHSDEFKFLDYPNTFLSDNFNDSDLNKSANSQLEENLKELIKVTNGNKQPNQQQAISHLNGIKTSYLDELNDLKELKRIEDKKSYQQSLDRLSKLNLGTNLTSNGGYNRNEVGYNNVAGYSASKTGIERDRRSTFKFTKSDIQSLRTFKSNNHLPSEPSIDNVKMEPKFDSSFDLRNYNGDDLNEQTFIVNNKLLNLSGNGVNQHDDDDDVNNTFVVAKNYDEVQEIARKQEEALKKSKTTPSFLPSTPLSINNATIVKVKKNGFANQNKFDTTITLKHFINENLNDNIKSPNLDGTFNLGNPLENLNFSPSPSAQSTNNGTIKKEKFPNSRSFILNPKNATNLKKVLNNRLNSNLDSKNNRLNSSFIVGEVQPKIQVQQQATDDNKSDFNNILNVPSNQIKSNQFSTKNKINKNLKRTNTFKVREFQFASSENLTFNKNGTHLLNPNFIVKSGLSVNNYQSIDDMKNYETIKLSQTKFNKINSKSNGQINQNKNLESNENLTDYYKHDPKLPAFASRLKAPSSRVSILKSEEI